MASEGSGIRKVFTFLIQVGVVFFGVFLGGGFFGLEM